MPTPPAAWTDFGTTLIYRNIVLANCHSKEFSQVATYDPSNTDLLCQKFRISVVAHIHEEHESIGFGVSTESAGISGLAQAANPTVTAQRIQAWLMQPRGDLKLLTEGITILEARGPATLPINAGARDPVDVNNHAVADLYDVKNGPHPISCSVTHIAGMKAYEIVYTIEAHINLCDPDIIIGNNYSPGHPDVPAGTQMSLEVLSNRWSISETRNSDMMMTRTFTGLLTVRSYTTFAQAFRHLCVPAQPRGFQRQRMAFVQSPDGLSIQYTVVDQQRHAAPPRPAIDWKGTHQVQVNGFGQNGMETVSLWLQGTPSTSKEQLFNAAIATVRHRLGDIQNKGDVAGQSVLIPMSMNLVDFLDKPEIQFSVTVKVVPDDTKKWANIMYDALGKLPAVNHNAVPEGGDETSRNDADRDDITDPQYNRDKWPTPLPYDSSSPSGLFATFLQNPCVGWHGMPDLNEETPEDTYAGHDDVIRSTPTISYYQGEAATNFPSPDGAADFQLSQSHKDFQYTHFELESKYVVDNGIQAMPLARPQPTSTSPQVCIARVSHPITYRDVWLKAKRVGKNPETPEASETLTDTNGIEETLVKAEVVPIAPRLLANGQQYEYEIEAYYRYVLNRTPTAAEKLRAGSLPWDVTTKVNNEVAMADTHSAGIL